MVRVCLHEVDINCRDVMTAFYSGEASLGDDVFLRYEDGKLYYCEPDYEDWDGPSTLCHDISKVLRLCLGGE